MSDRAAQARAEAYAQTANDEQFEAFMDGAEWADANPYSTPEALVAAYEDGQRDAVEKGLAKVRVAEDEFERAWRDAVGADRRVEYRRFLALMGIEVVDDE